MVILVGGLMALRHGFNRGVLFSTACTAVLVLISLYFDTRNRDAPPDRLERSLALTWLVFRRAVGLGAALCVLAGATLAVLKVPMTPGLLLGLLIALLFAAFCAWVGWYGQGPRRYEYRDDVRQHEANKRRYGWRR